MRFKLHDECSRVSTQIEKHGRDCLPENFNMEMYRYPVWHVTDSQKCMSEDGFDNYPTGKAAHVKQIKHPGAGTTVYSLEKAAWEHHKT